MNTNSNLRRAARTLATRPARAAGFTLIEMMISITIGLGILAGLVGVLATNSSNSRSNDRTSELMTNGRYALNTLKQELREAGFRGYTWGDPTDPGAFAAVTGECLDGVTANGTFVSNIRQGIWGSNDANPFTGSCIPAANYLAGNDVLVVRRVGVIPLTAAELAASNANRFHFLSSFNRGQVFRGTTAPTFTGATAPLQSFTLQNYVYYISPSTGTEVPPIPALYRIALLGDGTMVRELVASGIEHLQVQYGYLDTSGATRYVNAGTAPLTANAFSTAAGTATEWELVNSVRIWLLARNATAEPGYSNTNTYAMGGQNFVKADGFRRQLFSTVVNLRN